MERCVAAAQGDALNSGLLQYINPLSENEKKAARVGLVAWAPP